MKILSVAEKPSVAKELSNIIAGGLDKCIQRQGQSQFNKIFEIKNCSFKGMNCDMMMTSVTGHMMEIEFDIAFKSWTSCTPAALFTAPIKKAVKKDCEKIRDTLVNLAKQCDILLLWLDCDMEGENIAYEVIHVCKTANPRLDIYRARFSALIKRDIMKAMQLPDKPNQNLNEAVEARQEIDLRLGAIFTRFQTLRLQSKFDELRNTLISYGPCQFPTLGFVVDADDKIKKFVSEKFWKLKCSYQHPDSDEKSGFLNVDFNWDRGAIYDQFSCLLLFDLCFDYCEDTEENPKAIVSKVEAKPTSKYRPLPMNTIELQMRASKYLKISSDQTMHVAESLYQRGIISYPRTETDFFKEGFDINSILNDFRNHSQFGSYTKILLDENKFLWPRKGTHDDQAHPPIHPTKSVELNELNDIEKKVYELVTRHFLACCSQDAKGNETSISICIPNRVSEGEYFHTTGLMILEKNWLDIYSPYEKWYANKVPVFKKGDDFILTTFLMLEGETTAPLHISEADLIKKMDETGIGTDATIAEHIKTILKREYVYKDNQRFIPSNLGRALVEGYNSMGYYMTSPELRAVMERDCKKIARGETSKEIVIANCLNKMKECYENILKDATKLDESISKFYGNDSNNNNNKTNYNDNSKYTTINKNISTCGICRKQLEIKAEITNGDAVPKKIIYCEECNKGYNIPSGNVEFRAHEIFCPICQFQVLLVTNKTTNKEYSICPYCFRKPPGPPFSEDGIIEFRCLSCANIDCNLSGRNVNDDIDVCPCSIIGCMGFIRLKKGNNKFFFSCNRQECKFTSWLPNQGIKSAQTSSDQSCQRCQTKANIKVMKVMLELNLKSAPRGLPPQLIICPCCDPIWLNDFRCGQLPLPSIQSINLDQRNFPASIESFGSDYNIAITSLPSINRSKTKNNTYNTKPIISNGNATSNSVPLNNVISNRNNNINSDNNNPFCACGEPAVIRISQKDNENKGRKFYACNKNMSDKCKFFKWEDELNNPQNLLSSSNNKQKTTIVKSTKPFQNNNNNETITCFKCKQVGHYSRQCPLNNS